MQAKAKTTEGETTKVLEVKSEFDQGVEVYKCFVPDLRTAWLDVAQAPSPTSKRKLPIISMVPSADAVNPSASCMLQIAIFPASVLICQEFGVLS